MLYRGQQHPSNPGRIQTGGEEINTPLGNNNGGRPHYHPQKLTLRRTQGTTLWPPRNKQDMQ